MNLPLRFSRWRAIGTLCLLAILSLPAVAQPAGRPPYAFLRWQENWSGLAQATSPVIDLYPPDPPFLANLSGRGRVQPGVHDLVAGFVVANRDHLTPPITMLLRGVGPSLTDYDVTSPATDPRLHLRTLAGEELAHNDDAVPLGGFEAWMAAKAGIFPLRENSADAVLLWEAPPAVYTATVSAAPGSSGGVALAEIFRLRAIDDSSELINLSLRGRSGPGDDVLIGGFIVRDHSELQRPLRVLIRAIGPGLRSHGIHGVMSDPELTLFNAEGEVVAWNDNWSDGDPNLAVEAARLGAFALEPGSTDAALLVELPPGLYTAHAGGVEGANGEVLLELYRLPVDGY